MARLSKDQWQELREAYEVRCVSAYELSKTFNIAESTISRRIKKDAWDRQKTQVVIAKKVSATKAFEELKQVNASITQAVNQEVTERLRLEGLFNTDAEHNQNGATKKLKQMEAGQEAELAHYDIHARITAKNKETLLGKTPQTQVNIQNNVGTDADAVIARLMAKHQ